MFWDTLEGNSRHRLNHSGSLAMPQQSVPSCLHLNAWTTKASCLRSLKQTQWSRSQTRKLLSIM
eukprot:scaffold1365_cov163-Ochromonas_danica.AAC.53